MILHVRTRMRIVGRLATEVAMCICVILYIYTEVLTIKCALLHGNRNEDLDLAF